MEGGGLCPRAEICFVFFAGRAKGKEKDGGTTESAQPPRCALLVQ